MLGREIETIDGNGNHAYKEYDSAGRVISEKTKISGKDAIKKYKYDNNGNVLKESIKNNKPGDTTTYRNIYYKYDRMNRPVSTNTDEEGETKYTYDAAGNILTMTTGVTDTDAGVTTRYQYSNDARNLLVKLTDPMGYTETYTYDGNGNVITKTDKNGTVTTNTYDGIDNVLSTTAGTETISYEYMQWGSLVKSVTNETGTITYGYNNKGMLTEQHSARGGGGSQDWAGEVVETYSYDKNGNLTNQSKYYYYNPEIGEDEDYMYDKYYFYKKNYTYDAFNRMITYHEDKFKEEIDPYNDLQSSTNASYTYDAAGQRISKTVDGVTTNHIWDNNGNIVVENDKIYNRGLGGEIISAGDNYYAYNGHGDTTNLTKQSSGVALAIAANYEYDAFGNCLATGGEADSNPFRYNGQYYDEESGLIYLRNRYYDPSIGRFTQEDPY